MIEAYSYRVTVRRPAYFSRFPVEYQEALQGISAGIGTLAEVVLTSPASAAWALGNGLACVVKHEKDVRAMTDHEFGEYSAVLATAFLDGLRSVDAMEPGQAPGMVVL